MPSFILSRLTHHASQRSTSGLLYCGVSVLLTAVSGLWVASTAHKDIVYYYYIALLPVLTMLLLAAAGISLRKLADAGKDVSEQFDTLSLPGFGKGSTIDDVQVRCYAMLCYAMLCYAMLCYAMLYYTILYSTLVYSTLLTLPSFARILTISPESIYLQHTNVRYT